MFFFSHVQRSFPFQEVLCVLFLEALSEDISAISDLLGGEPFESSQTSERGIRLFY